MDKIFNNTQVAFLFKKAIQNLTEPILFKMISNQPLVRIMQLQILL
jgi:hypothetical protein